jgi:TonB family protein
LEGTVNGWWLRAAGAVFAASTIAMHAVLTVAGTPVDDYYPPESRKLHEEGTTRVKVCVNERGKLIGDPVVVASSGYPRLDEASIKLAKAGSGRYKPATRDGKPVADCTEFNINWKLR